MKKLKSDDMRHFYNNAVRKRYKNNYEHYMWFSSLFRWERYLMNFNVIDFHLNKKLNIKNIFELGPGSGIWTRELINLNQNVNFTLFDISDAMLSQSKLNLGERKNIKFIRGDFLKDVEKSHKEKYDLFFSSRVLEYIADKKEFFKNVDFLLKKNSNVLIITKLAHPLRQKIGSYIRKTPLIHTQQSTPEEIRSILKQFNFKDIEIYPAIVSVPFLEKLPFLNRFLWNLIYKKKIAKFFYPITESFVIKFKK